MRSPQTRRLRLVERERVALRQVRRLGLIVFACQLIALVVWSGFEANRAVQGADFVGFFQSWYLIAHGTLNAANWFAAQGVLIQWPLAVFGLIWPHTITLLVVQDCAIVGAELVAYFWICDLVAHTQPTRLRAYCLIGLALLALDPWIYWSASWDYHSEALGTLFAVLAARDLFRGRRMAWLWCALALFSGMVPATYLIGIGIALLFTRRRRTAGCAVAIAGAGWFLVLTQFGVGRTLGYATAQAVAAHQAAPASIGTLSTRITTLLTMLQQHWVNLIANVAPSGVLGIFTAPVAGIVAVTLGENFSQGNPNSVVPSFQGLPIYVFVPVGTVVALMWLERRVGARFAYALSVVALANVVGWAAVWLPKVVPTWLRVSATQAAAIKHVHSLIPQADGVVVSQGIAGEFADHRFVRMFFGTPMGVRVSSPYTWFVVAPYAGIETATVQQSVQLISALAHNPRATLRYYGSGIWAFRVRVPAALARKNMFVAGGQDRLSAAMFATNGTAVRRGPVQDWFVRGSDQIPGPLVWGDYYLESVGTYHAQVALSGFGTAVVQVWNVTTNRLLASRTITISKRATVVLPAAISRSDPPRSAAPARGAGPFQIKPVRALAGNYLELLVYARSPTPLTAKWVSIRRDGPRGQPSLVRDPHHESRGTPET